MINPIFSKISKYEAEDKLFENKYSANFSTFKQQVDVMENTENYVWDDDLLDWEFAHQSLEYWQNKLNIIK